MMNRHREFTKVQRRRIRELGAMAYERELSAELSKLEAEFGRWRANEIDAHELSDRIHRFHQGPARDLYTSYDHSNLDFMVARAIHRGLITEKEISADDMEMLSAQLAFLRDQDNDNSAQVANPPEPS